MTDLVTLERPREGVALLTYRAPEINNHVSWRGIEAIADGLTEARTGGARVTVLASDTPGHWLEHAWLPDLRRTLRGEPTEGDIGAWFRALDELGRQPVVTIAAIAGDTSGGGCELGWTCDLRVAEPQATFSQPEVMIGLTTGIGGTSRLARLIGRCVTAEMVFDGAPLPASRLYELGGINRVVETGQAVAASLAWAERLATRPPGALAALKRILNDNNEVNQTFALQNEQRIFQAVAATADSAAQLDAIQARFDAGASIRDVYGPPREVAKAGRATAVPPKPQ